MVKPFNGFETNTGKLFKNEEAAVREEVLDELCKIVPELVLIRPRLDSNLRALAVAMGPMLNLVRVPSEGPMDELSPPTLEIRSHAEARARGFPTGPEMARENHPSCICGMGKRDPMYHRRDCPVYETWALGNHSPDVVDLADRLAGRA